MSFCKKEIELVLKYCPLDIAEAKDTYPECKTDEEIAIKLIDKGAFNFNIICQYALQDSLKELNFNVQELCFQISETRKYL